MPKHLFAFVVTFIFATPAAFAMEEKAENCAGGHPCKVVFTLDEENNIILEDVYGNHHRNEGVLRLTSEQAIKAAEGPVSENNILAPKLQRGEFADTVKALAAVPGLSFLRGESTGGAAAAAPPPERCQQIKTVMEATLEDAQNGTMQGDQFITASEVKAVCPAARAQALNDWYAAEKRQFLLQ